MAIDSAAGLSTGKQNQPTYQTCKNQKTENHILQRVLKKVQRILRGVHHHSVNFPLVTRGSTLSGKCREFRLTPSLQGSDPFLNHLMNVIAW